MEMQPLWLCDFPSEVEVTGLSSGCKRWRVSSEPASHPPTRFRPTLGSWRLRLTCGPAETNLPFKAACRAEAKPVRSLHHKAQQEWLLGAQRPHTEVQPRISRARSLSLACLSRGWSDLSRIIRARAKMACQVGRLQLRCRLHPVKSTKEERSNPRKVLAEQSSPLETGVVLEKEHRTRALIKPWLHKEVIFLKW